MRSYLPSSYRGTSISTSSSSWSSSSSTSISTNSSAHERGFCFERLDVYRVAKEAVTIGIGERHNLKGLPGEVASQFERALTSTMANIAEGAGRETPKDQRRHYAIARGSANEAGSHLILIGLYGGLTIEKYEAIRTRLIRVVQMLNAMIK